MMKLKELIPSSEQLKFAQGIEKNLLDRKRKGVILSGVVSVAGGLLQVLISTTGDRKISDIADGIGYFFQCVYYIFVGQWDKLRGYQPSYELAGVFILAIGLGIYFLFKRTRLLLKESEEPFRYTFWVEPFKRVKEDSTKSFDIDSGDDFHPGDERLKNLLHHDLMERVNGRIRRLSLLDWMRVSSVRVQGA